MIVPANLYLLAVLNSKLADYYIRSLRVTRNGGYFEYKPMFIEKLPIPLPEKYSSNTLYELQKPTSLHDLNIDELVYALYELNKNEINFIENHS